MAKKLTKAYWASILWIAANDDTVFMDEADPESMASVTLTMVANVHGVEIETAVAHLRKALELQANWQAKQLTTSNHSGRGGR